MPGKGLPVPVPTPLPPSLPFPPSPQSSRVILIVPDRLDRTMLKDMMDVLLTRMEFAAAFVHQVHMHVHMHLVPFGKTDYCFIHYPVLVATYVCRRSPLLCFHRSRSVRLSVLVSVRLALSMSGTRPLTCAVWRTACPILIPGGWGDHVNSERCHVTNGVVVSSL